MNTASRFWKVSFEQYMDDWKKYGRTISTDEEIKEIQTEWEDIRLPERATSGSAGYDFFIPRTTKFYVNLASFFPTGIRCQIERGWFLMLVPKSGLGSRYGMRLMNTTGVVDEDYFNSANEGHIQAGFCANKDFTLKKGDKFMQGILVPYGITIDDHATGIRNGGFGSTGA